MPEDDDPDIEPYKPWYLLPEGAPHGISYRGTSDDRRNGLLRINQIPRLPERAELNAMPQEGSQVPPKSEFIRYLRRRSEFHWAENRSADPVFEVVKLFVLLSSAAASGIIGNAAWELVKRISLRLRDNDSDYALPLTRAEADEAARHGLHLYRQALDLVDNMGEYRVKDSTVHNSKWVFLISLTANDAMPYQVTVYAKRDAAGEIQVYASIW